jgi:aquaporin Z
MFGGTLVFLYITFETPLSGMSINPARTFVSALPSGIWTSAWIYFAAPLAGMLLAAEIHHTLVKRARVSCAKWNHDMRYRCIFCGHPGVQPGDDAVIQRGAAPRENGSFKTRLFAEDP